MDEVSDPEPIEKIDPSGYPDPTEFRKSEEAARNVDRGKPLDVDHDLALLEERLKRLYIERAERVRNALNTDEIDRVVQETTKEHTALRRFKNPSASF